MGKPGQEPARVEISLDLTKQRAVEGGGPQSVNFQKFDTAVGESDLAALGVEFSDEETRLLEFDLAPKMANLHDVFAFLG